MQEELKTERLDAQQDAEMRRAVQILRSGGTVAFPTETVYGLGANALDAHAVAKIFWAKQRPEWDPLIVHVADRSMVADVARVKDECAGRVHTLMDRFWPGPLTLLLPRTSAVPDTVTSGRELVGLRMPGHAVARRLIELAGVPVAAPSANRFGHTSPTTAAHVLADLEGRIDAVLDGGAADVGVESTVLDPEPWPMVLYRPGAVTVEMLESACGAGCVQMFVAETSVKPPEALPSPGVGIRHYAPRARLVLAPGGPEDLQSLVDALASEARVGVLLPDGWILRGGEARFAWGPWTDRNTLAQRLFSGLRELDDLGVTVILAPVPQGGGIAAALRDRLEKAAREA